MGGRQLYLACGSWPMARGREEMQLAHVPRCGDSVGLRSHGLQGARCYVLLPTKTSLLLTQSSGISEYHFRAGSQISFTIWRESLFHLILLANILSLVSVEGLQVSDFHSLGSALHSPRLPTPSDSTLTRTTGAAPLWEPLYQMAPSPDAQLT